MPMIGKPPSVNDNKYNNITIRKDIQKQLNDDKEKVLNQAAGSKSPFFVDKRKHNVMGKNEFLKLLTHQLANQDPLNPMDQKKLTDDLVQFSSLEQLTNMGTKLDNLGMNAPIENKFYGASFLGKQVMTKGTTLQFKGEEIEIPFSLPIDASKALIRIFDKNGQLVRQIEKENLSQGGHNIKWDGKQFDGYLAANGTYNVHVHAWDQNLAEFNGETKSSGTVKGVRFVDGEVVLDLNGGRSVFLRDVESFKLLEQNIETLSTKNNPGLQKKVAATYANQLQDPLQVQGPEQDQDQGQGQDQEQQQNQGPYEVQ